MRGRPAITTLLLVATAIFSLPSLAAVRSGNISGIVRNSRGIPQMGAAVEISPNPSSNAAVTAYTDDHGRYAAKGLPAGHYQIKVTAASFLPTMREDISLHAGANLLVNLTLNTLFEALQIMPVRGRTTEDADDWKWTLRSMANRPILRVMDNSPLVVVANSDSQDDRVIKARVAFLAGSSSDGFAGAPDHATSFNVESSIFSTDKLTFTGNVGENVRQPAVLRASYSHQFSNGDRPQLSLTARRFAAQISGDQRESLQALALSLSNQMRLSDFAEMEYGTEYQTLQFMGRTAAFRPFGTLDLHLSPNTVLEYRYASSQPTTREEKGFDSAPADLSESGPRVSLSNFAPELERARHQEISISRRFGKNNFQLAGYSDHTVNTSLLGLGDNARDDNSGSVLADPYSQFFTYNGGTLSTGGVRAVAQRKFSSALTGTLDVAYGGVLALDRPGTFALENAAAQDAFENVHRAAIAAKLSGRVPKSRTTWMASYKWNSGTRNLTAVDGFNASPGQADPYLNLFIRQPLPSGNFLPGQMEALIDLRNLLAQGYVPVIGEDGHTLYLVQSARSLRGGLAFSF